MLGSDLQLRDLPVIVTSSLEGIDNVVRCIELGAEDYLHKPVNPGAAQGAHRREPREEAPARPAEGAGAPLRHAAKSRRTCSSPASRSAAGACARTVMFSDIRGFTPLAESQPPEETIELLNTYYALMFDAISGHGGIVTLMVGDGLMAVFGAPLPLPDACDSAVRTRARR